MKKVFGKSDLKDGMIVERRDGVKALWLNGKPRGIEYHLGTTCFDLTNFVDSSFDIIAVYEYPDTPINDALKRNSLKCIWKREPEQVEMTMAEICKVFGKNIKIVEGK